MFQRSQGRPGFGLVHPGPSKSRLDFDRTPGLVWLFVINGHVSHWPWSICQVGLVAYYLRQ